MRGLSGTVAGMVLCLAASGPALAADGIRIVQRVTIDGTAQTSEVRIAKDRMRADISDPSSGAKQLVVFDATRQVVDIISPDTKTYMEITKAQIEQMTAQAQQMMQTAMANMPPEQRAQMEAMMRGRGMGSMMAAVKTTYHKTGTDHVGRWTCDKYEGFQNEKKVTDLCTVDPNAIGLAAADVQTLNQLVEFFKSLSPASATMFEIGHGESQGFSGIPVRTSTSTAGRSVTSELTDVVRENLPDALFQIPAGYQEQPFMGGMGGMRGGRGRN